MQECGKTAAAEEGAGVCSFPKVRFYPLNQAGQGGKGNAKETALWPEENEQAWACGGR